MKNRFAEDIRRIVGVDPTQSELAEAEAKEAINSKRGIGYQLPGSTTTGSVSGDGAGAPSGGTEFDGATFNRDTGTVQKSVPDQDNPSDPSGDVTQNGGLGNIVDPRSPGSGTYGDGAGEYSIDDIIDQDEDGTYPTIGDDVQSGLGALDNRSGGTFNALDDIVDCASGTGIDLRLDGMFKPPAGWEDIDTPPLLPRDEQQKIGQQWRVRFNGFGTAPHAGLCVQTPGVAYSTLLEALTVYTDSIGSCFVSIDDISYSSEDYCSTVGLLDNAVVTLTESTGACGGGDPTIPNYIYMEELTCTPNGTTCPSVNVEREPLTEWPSDGKMQLAFIDGVWVHYEKENATDIIPKFTDGAHGQIDFCFGAGNSRNGTLRPSRTGGFILYETSGGVATGIVTIFNSARQVTGYTDSSGVQAYLPL